MAFRYIVQATERRGDILLLTLAPKNKHRRMNFEPGQYATIGFLSGFRPTPMRCFSIVSTPTSGVLQFAMRVRGNFTQAAAQLQQGSIVRVQGPFGSFTINPEYDQNVVMLAGGIGITPFLSMIRDATERRQRLPITLWYANRSVADVPFRGQLMRLAEQNPNLHVRFFNNDSDGKITEAHLQQLQSTTSGNTTYFICGPRSFSESMKSTLEAEGVHESRIISESFAQSTKVTLDSGLSIHSLTYGLSAAALVFLTGAVMLLDLRQNLPKVAAARITPDSSQNNNTNSSTATTNTNSSSSTANSSTSSGTSTTTPAPATTSSPSQSTPSYTYYQPPVSSVS